MSVHYSDVKGLASGQAKAKVLEAFVAASMQHPAVRTIVHGAPAHVTPGTLTWDMVSHAHRARPTPLQGIACSSQDPAPGPQWDERPDKGEKKSKAKKDKKVKEKGAAKREKDAEKESTKNPGTAKRKR